MASVDVGTQEAEGKAFHRVWDADLWPGVSGWVAGA